MIYLYRKMDESLDWINNITEYIDLVKHASEAMKEHRHAWHVLDEIVGLMQAGDFLCVAKLADLGDSVHDQIRRIELLVNRGCGVIVSEVQGTYLIGFDLNMNKIVVDGVLCGLGASGTKKIKKDGRPRLLFPDGWDEMYEKWKSGKVGSKEFQAWSGFKRATFYNKIDDYEKMLRDEKDNMNCVG